MSEHVYLQFNHPKLVSGSSEELAIIETLFKSIFTIARQSTHAFEATDLYMNTKKECMDVLEIEKNYSLSLRMFDSLDNAEKSIKKIEDFYQTEDMYCDNIAISSESNELYSDAFLIFLGVVPDNKEIDYSYNTTKIDWNAYCCLVTLY